MFRNAARSPELLLFRKASLAKAFHHHGTQADRYMQVFKTTLTKEAQTRTDFGTMRVNSKKSVEIEVHSACFNTTCLLRIFTKLSMHIAK